MEARINAGQGDRGAEVEGNIPPLSWLRRPTLWRPTRLKLPHMQARSSDFKPERLDILAFTRAGASLAGSTPLSAFSRLAHSTHGADHPESPPPEGDVHWQADGEWRERVGSPPQVWLHLTAHTTLPMTCQRCLLAVDEALEVDRWFRFVASESEATEQDAEADEDLLVQSRQFKLLELIEDELVLELPLIASHAVCPEPLPMQAGHDEDETPADAKPNPFAVLESLKKPGRRNGH